MDLSSHIYSVWKCLHGTSIHNNIQPLTVLEADMRIYQIKIFSKAAGISLYTPKLPVNNRFIT